MRKFVWILFILLIGFFELNAQAQKIKLNSITIEGNETADAGSIRLNSGLSAGIEITGEDLQQAVRNLWSLHIFSDIQIYVSDQTIQGLDLLIKVKEFSRLSDVKMTGYDELSKEDVEDEINTYRGMVITPYKIFRMKKNLLNKYHEEGYLLAEVEFDTLSAGKNRVNLDINIKEGEEVQVERIQFHDNENFDDEDLRDEMDEIKEDTWWRSADFDPKKYEEDKKLIVQFYKENGFRDAEIVRDSVSYNEDKTDLYIDIWVYEGNKYYFDEITFDGNVIFSDEEMAFNLDISRGDIYDQKKYDEGIRDRLQKMYYNQGYLFAQIQQLLFLKTPGDASCLLRDSGIVLS